MPSLHAGLLKVTALSTALFTSLAAHAQAPQDMWGFESGDLTGWTTYGGAQIIASDTLLLGDKVFEVGAKDNFMAKISPSGSGITKDAVEALLGLTAGTFAATGVTGYNDSTNYGFITGTTFLAAGEYSFGWSYAAQDYDPYDDGVFFSLAGAGTSSVQYLASNFSGQPDTVIVGDYGSTPWHLTTFTITTEGLYQLGFGGYNFQDRNLDPILYLDNGLGRLLTDGVITLPAGTHIDGSAPYYKVSDLEAGTLLPVFSGGTLLIDTPGIFQTGLTINIQGGTIDANGEDSTFAGDIDGMGGLTITGPGRIILTGSNSYTGSTIVDGSTLQFGSQQAISTGSSDITLNGGSTIQAGADLVFTQSFGINGVPATFDTGAFNVTLLGNGTGDACIIKTGTGALNVLALVQNSGGACVRQGLMSFNGIFNGGVDVAAGSSIGGRGRINGDVIVSGTLAPGNSPGILEVNGSVTQLATSTLAIDIDGATAGNGAGHHDALVLIGADSVYTAAGTLAPQLRGISGDATNSFTPAHGQTFEIVSAEGGVTGNFETVTQPTSGLPSNSRLDVLYQPNSLLLVVTPGSYALASQGTNAGAAGNVLDQLRPVAGVRPAGQVGALFNRLSTFNSSQIDLALEQLSGSVHASMLDAAVESNRDARATILQHAKANRLAAQGVTPSHGVWATAGNLEGTVRSDETGRGYEHDSQSYTMGFDFAAGPDLTLGIAGTYSESKADAAALGTGNGTNFVTSIYGMWSRGGSYATAQFGVGGSNYKTSRAAALVATPSTLRSNANGTSFGFEAEVGHRYDLGGFGVTPLAGLSYDKVSRAELTESGDNLVALTFGNERRVAWATRAGTRLDTGDLVAKGNLRGYASGAIVHQLSDTRAELSPVLRNLDFRVNAADAGRTAFQGEAGVTGLLHSNIEINVGYRHFSAGNAHANSVNGTVRVRW